MSVALQLLFWVLYLLLPLEEMVQWVVQRCIDRRWDSALKRLQREVVRRRTGTPPRTERPQS